MGRWNEIQTLLFPELSSHIDEKFMDDQAHLKGLAHETTSQFKPKTQLCTYDTLPEINAILVQVGMIDTLYCALDFRWHTLSSR